MARWSALRGQTKNPHVEGEIPPGSPFLTSWGPAGSSSGSATAVTAGFSPLSLGTELEGSITWPAARAGLYAIKLTPGSVDQHGFQPGAAGFDCQGPYAKTTIDAAILSAIIQRLSPDHYLPLRTTWNGLRLGFVEPSQWRTPGDVVEEVDGFFHQTDTALLAASRTIEERGGIVVTSVNLSVWEDIIKMMPDLDYMGELFNYQMKLSCPKFLALWEGTPQTVEDLIRWNEEHADLEFTLRDNNQRALENIRDSTMTEEQYNRNVKALRTAARDAIDRVLSKHNLDVVLGPCDSRLNSMAAAAGYPLGNLPLGYADFNGRGFSLHIIAPAGDEAKIFQVMSAWETTFPENVRPPRVMTET
ncbi:amidase signature domain-containing protein [Xylaria arbuscula]|nr:amidase signature domain-containing protein [Xylaria arbuscula]